MSDEFACSSFVIGLEDEDDVVLRLSTMKVIISLVETIVQFNTNQVVCFKMEMMKSQYNTMFLLGRIPFDDDLYDALFLVRP